MKRRLNGTLAFTCFLLATFMSGCSTLEGVGKDMQTIGQGIGNSNSANKQVPSDQSNTNGAVVTPIK